MVRNYIRKTEEKWSHKLLKTVLKRISDRKLDIHTAIAKYPISRATIYRHLKAKDEGDGGSDSEESVDRKISTRGTNTPKNKGRRKTKKQSPPVIITGPRKRTKVKTQGQGQGNGSDVESTSSEDTASDYRPESESSGSLWSDEEEMMRVGIMPEGDDVEWKPSYQGPNPNKGRKRGTEENEKRSLRERKSKEMGNESTPTSPSKTLVIRLERISPPKKTRTRK